MINTVETWFRNCWGTCFEIVNNSLLYCITGWPLTLLCFSYGYATNTKVKLVLITEAGSTQGADPEMKKVSHIVWTALTSIHWPNVVVFLETSWHCCICTPSELSATINGECVPCDCCSALGFLSHSFWGAYMWRMSLQFVTLSMSRERKFVLSEWCMILWCVLVCECSSGIMYIYGTLVAVQYVQ